MLTFPEDLQEKKRSLLEFKKITIRALEHLQNFLSDYKEKKNTEYISKPLQEQQNIFGQLIIDYLFMNQEIFQKGLMNLNFYLRNLAQGTVVGQVLKKN